MVVGGGDGGIDGIYLFINGKLLNDELNIDDLKKDINFDVYIIQSKKESGFKEGAINRLISSAKDIFYFSKNLKDLGKVYNI